ncbi:MAG: sugar phosphate isomerase/epimerase [Tannerella sp.]|jgi:inosose dehydratase|nr:sugar phosphate isomerase/epimerase [Tannerella sp.]
MDRRKFIKNVAVSSALLAGGGFESMCTVGRAKPENIRWSMGWILWRDFSGGSVPLAEAIRNISELGLDGIEFTPRKDELAKHGFTRESFRDLLAEKKLSVSGNYFSARFYDPSKREEVLTAFGNMLENLQFYGAKQVIIGPPGRVGDDMSEMIRGTAPVLNELGKIAKDAGLQIGLHPHVNTIVETPGEIDLIMELTDPRFVAMVPDTGHIRLGGGNVVEIVRKYRDRLSYFHLKDSAGKFNRPDFGANLRELGKGEVDFPGIMEILKQVGYTGWLNVEQDHTFMTPLESATESMKYINSTLKPLYT